MCIGIDKDNLNVDDTEIIGSCTEYYPLKNSIVYNTFMRSGDAF